MRKFFQNFSLLGIVMLGLCVLLGVGDVSGAVLCADGVAVDPVNQNTNGDPSGAVITHGERQALETTDVRKLRPEMIQDPVDQNLVQIRPTLTPLDTLMRYAKPMSTSNFEFSWYSIDTRPVDDTIATATLTDNAKPEGVYGVITLSGNQDLIDETDTLYIPSVKGKDNKPLMLYVTKKTSTGLEVTISDKQMSFDSSSSKYSIPAAVTTGVVVYRLGRASAETDVLTPATSYLPTKSTGYCQIFKCQIAQSTYEKMMTKEIKWDFNEIEEQALYEFRLAMEASMLFGEGGKIYDRNKKKYVYTTDGIVNNVTKTHQLDVTDKTKGNEELIKLCRTVFQGNAGAKSRVMFAGSKFVEYLSTIQSVQKQVDAGNTEVVWGMEWKTIKTNFGTLLLMQHDLFDQYGWSEKALIIDPNYIKKWQLKSMERFKVDAKGSAILDGEITVFTEVCGAAVYYPSTHCIVTLKTA